MTEGKIAFPSDPLYWIWLSLSISSSSPISEKLLAYFDYDPVAIYEAKRDDYLSLEGLTDDNINRLCDKSMNKSTDIIRWCERYNIGLLPYDCSAFPSRLKSIPRKPFLLYFKGALPNIDECVCIGMVGTRRASDYGRRQSYKIAYDVAKAGAVVVSGGARGIDTCSHRGCIDGGGHTIAVLGTGIDIAYPIENKALFDEIAQKGTLIR